MHSKTAQPLKRQIFHYKVEANLYFIPTEEVNSRGNPKCLPLTVRKLFLFSNEDGFWAKRMRINRYIRKGEVKYTVSKLEETPLDIWSLNQIKDSSWKKMETFTEIECLRWLDRVLGSQSVEAIYELTNKKPEKE